jgi:hypothetical protein
MPSNPRCPDNRTPYLCRHNFIGSPPPLPPLCTQSCPAALLLPHNGNTTQYKAIRTTRFVVAGTIEERILKLQDKKQAVFEGTVGRDAEALGRLTEDDLRFLFG